MTRTVWIYESEVRSVAQETFSWRVETGGHLFGFWEPEPVVMLATRAGGNVERMLGAHRFDLAYLAMLSLQLHVDWGLFYLGDWHSHPPNRFVYPPPHNSHLPSSVDQNRIRQVGRRNRFPRMIEWITIPIWRDDTPESIRIYPYVYEISSEAAPEAMEIRVLPEVSPIREAFLKRGTLPEQRLAEFKLVSSSCIPWLQKTMETSTDLRSVLREAIHKRLREQPAWNLGSMSYKPTIP